MPAHRKPSAIKKLHGSRIRGVAKGRSEPAFSGTPRCPTWLHPLAKAEWKRITSGLAELDMLRATDQAALAAYCQAFARMVTAEQIVEAEGQTIQEQIFTRSGNPTGRCKTKRHPAVTIARDERASMLRAAALFGLNPTDRQRALGSADDQPLPFSADTDSDLFVN